MKDQLNIGNVPLNEPCAQIGTDELASKYNSRECTVFKAMLQRMADEGKFGPQGRAYFKITTNAHDFGSYKDVDVVFDDQDEEAFRFAYEVEANIPEEWDDQAKEDLGEDYFNYIQSKKQ